MIKLAIKVKPATKDRLEVRALENRRSLSAEAGLLLDQLLEPKPEPLKPVAPPAPARAVAPTAAVPPAAPAATPVVLTEVSDAIVPAVPAFTGI